MPLHPSFDTLVQAIGNRPGKGVVTSSPRPKASLFVTCVIDQLFPDVGESVVRVLRRQGVEVDFPRDQTCCGQPLYNSGFVKRARSLAKRVLRSFADSQYVVVPSGSCASMIRIFYPELFQGDPQLEGQARELASRTYELSQYLVKVLGVTDAGARYDGKVTYHPSCHLVRELGVSEEPRTLLGQVKGIELVNLEGEESCCGFGGTFSVKYPHISEGMLEDKVNSVASTGADLLVSCDMGCLMQIGGALSRRQVAVRPMHLAQLLDQVG